MIAPLPVLQTNSFDQAVDGALVAAPRISTLQINIGLVCNLACRHCHVESGPKRLAASENMSADTAERILGWIEKHPAIETIDITGGSPELNPNFRHLVTSARHLGRHVMDRCNPTIITATDPRSGEPMDWIPEFLAGNQVEVVASMPCYLGDNVEHQRGRGAYDASIAGLLALNAVGYGSDPQLPLNLVYNPNGAHLPPPQESLTDDYRRELSERYGIVFNELWTLTNMPIKRWRADLERVGALESYMDLLVDAFNPSTVDGLMCRHQIHCDATGALYDCDFNYALGLESPELERRRLWETTPEELASRRIATGDHCYGCTAGAGSSCGGSLT